MKISIFLFRKCEQLHALIYVCIAFIYPLRTYKFTTKIFSINKKTGI